MSEDVRQEAPQDEHHDTRGTFLITGIMLLGVIAVWLLVYGTMLTR